MLVLHITRQLDFGGVEKQCATIASVNKLSKFEHAFLAISHLGSAAKQIEAAGCSVNCLGFTGPAPSLLIILALARAIKEQSPQVVHTRGAEANLHGIIAARLAGVSTVIAEEVGLPQHSRRARIVFRYIYRFATRFIAISNSVADAVADLKEVNRRDIVTIYNPVASGIEKEVRAPFRDFRIGFVGRLEPEKNALELVKAVHFLRKKNFPIKLDIVGTGSQQAKIQLFIDEYMLHDNVILHGFHEEPFTLLEDCNLYVQPSLAEGFGIAIVEAVAAGLPVLVTPHGGASEFIEHGKNGWVLKGITYEEIACSLELISRLDDATVLAAGRRAQSELIERFSPSAYIKTIDELYCSALK